MISVYFSVIGGMHVLLLHLMNQNRNIYTHLCYVCIQNKLSTLPVFYRLQQ